MYVNTLRLFFSFISKEGSSGSRSFVLIFEETSYIYIDELYLLPTNDILPNTRWDLKGVEFESLNFSSEVGVVSCIFDFEEISYIDEWGTYINLMS